MTEHKRGQHPRSLANLGKPKTKAGRFNFTLSAQSVEWLSHQPNKSAAIDQLIHEKIMKNATLSPNQAYEIFVGCTVKEFLDGQSLDAAIENLMAERWWESDPNGTPAPNNLADLIREYVEGSLSD